MKTKNIIDQKNAGTNYSIREVENVSDMKVIIESGHLEDEIEQDF